MSTTSNILKKDTHSIKNGIEKLVVNVGLGRIGQQPQFKEKILPEILRELSLITGQKPSPRPARKSIAGFKVREGDVIGAKVTLREKRMDNFLTELINVVLPRVRDFRGIDLKNIDESGNLNLGFRDQSVFPEIDLDKSKVSFGLQITVVPKEKDREKALDLYKSIGIPLKGLAQESKSAKADEG